MKQGSARRATNGRRLSTQGLVGTTLLALVGGLAALALTPAAASADTFAKGVSAPTVLSSATRLVDAGGNPVAGLKAGRDGQGVSDLQITAQGEALVAEKNGRIAYFPSLSAKRGYLLTDVDGHDLSDDTLAVIDAGLGGIAVDPGWPAKPYVYALYLSNHKLAADGEGRWTAAECAGGRTCVVEGHLERLTVGTRTVDGTKLPYISARKTLLDRGWCQTANTHSVGGLAFGPDGYLYAAAGDGTPNGSAVNGQASGCADVVDPSVPSRFAPLDALDPDVSPSYNGKILRLDPSTGDAAPGNPWASSPDPRRQRIIAMGFRNPYRITFRPGTSELDVAVVGQARTEAVYTIADPLAGADRLNAGWPCWEVDDTFSSGSLCTGLDPALGNVLPAAVAWSHGAKLGNEPCDTGTKGSAAMGLTWGSSSMRSGTRDVLYFGDYARGCVWARKGTAAPVFVASLPNHTARSLATAPDGRIYFVDYQRGSVRRLTKAGSSDGVWRPSRGGLLPVR